LLFRAEAVYGRCYVICFDPDHSLTIAEMEQRRIVGVIETWKKLYTDLKATPEPGIEYLQIFENKGSAMGCSNPHPHGQCWATSVIPDEPGQEFTAFQKYREKRGSCLLCDYTKAELTKKERVVVENERFVALCPYWALWPFETMVLGKRHLRSLADLDSKDILDLADILSRLTCRYDNLFKTSFPYSMGIHQSPLRSNVDCCFHIHFYPPLLRSATVKKFLVGFDMLGMPQRDLTVEAAASRLRDQSETHFKKIDT